MTSPKIGKDEEHVVKQGQVCRKIKEILEDKINQGKISEKWIEECLPAEYKRKYIKSDLSSLSKQRPKRQLIEVRTGGNQITEQQDEKGIDWPSERQPTNKMQSEDKSEQRRVVIQAGESEALAQENEELKEALRRQTAMQSADQVSQSELKFTVPKARYEELQNAMHKSENLVYLIFDKSRTFVRAEPDVYN
jgi:hypothetical protein